MTYRFRDGRQQASRGDLFTRRYRSGGAFRERYGVEPSEAWIVLGTWPVDDGTMLHLHRAYQRDVPEAWFTPIRIDLPAGTLVFIRGNQMSFVYVHTLDVATVDVRLAYKLPRPSLSVRIRSRLTGKPAS